MKLGWMAFSMLAVVPVFADEIPTDAKIALQSCLLQTSLVYTTLATGKSAFTQSFTQKDFSKYRLSARPGFSTSPLKLTAPGTPTVNTTGWVAPSGSKAMVLFDDRSDSAPSVNSQSLQNPTAVSCPTSGPGVGFQCRLPGIEGRVLRSGSAASGSQGAPAQGKNPSEEQLFSSFEPRLNAQLDEITQIANARVNAGKAGVPNAKQTQMSDSLSLKACGSLLQLSPAFQAKLSATNAALSRLRASMGTTAAAYDPKDAGSGH